MANPDVEAVYIASPHQMHARHTALAAAHGKHVQRGHPPQGVHGQEADGQRAQRNQQRDQTQRPYGGAGTIRYIAPWQQPSGHPRALGDGHHETGGHQRGAQVYLQVRHQIRGQRQLGHREQERHDGEHRQAAMAEDQPDRPRHATAQGNALPRMTIRIELAAPRLHDQAAGQARHCQGKERALPGHRQRKAGNDGAGHRSSRGTPVCLMEKTRDMRAASPRASR
ncbi:hypothetical protein CDEF62S_00064 [Castellaniella defragrans]